MNQQKIKSRITEIAKENAVSFNEVWHRLVMERFLVRLAASRFSANFIFKGGFLLTKYTGTHRETRDLDFLVDQIKAEKNTIQLTLDEIASLNLEDGFNLSLESLNDLPHDHMKYPGFRAKFKVLLTGMREFLEIDIGVGDDVDHIEDSFELLNSQKKGSLFEDAVSLRMYPAEAIFAEKLETAVSRAELNSRMKDYHDLITLIEKDLLRKTNLANAIKRTFERRETALAKIPINFSDAQIKRLHSTWSSYLRKSATELPTNFKDVIVKINNFLASVGFL